MIRVVLLGTGNVSTHLYRAFSASKEIHVVQVYNHSEESLRPFFSKTNTTTSLEDLHSADIHIIALKDDKIPVIAAQLENVGGLVVHTSGAVALDVLKNISKSGVFYPLQTFSKQKEIAYSEIPFCVEAENPEDLEVLKKLAKSISAQAYEISSAQRKKLHLAAVFVSNFVNHMYVTGEEICIENAIPFEILKPLIKETAQKALISSPATVQTGPAIRNDQSTIDAHLKLLSSAENNQIYQLLTNAIQKFHGKKL